MLNLQSRKKFFFSIEILSSERLRLQLLKSSTLRKISKNTCFSVKTHLHAYILLRKTILGCLCMAPIISLDFLFPNKSGNEDPNSTF